MNKKTQNKQESERIAGSIQFILDTFENDNFIKSAGQYIKLGSNFIAPKYQDVLYAQTDKVKAKSIIEDQIKYLDKNSSDMVPSVVDGIFFLVPLSSVMALPPNYHSNRVILDADEKLDYALSITLVTGVQNNGKDNEGDDMLSGICFAVLGYRSVNIKGQGQHAIYQQCVDYLNDFITAYKLFRHDHTVMNVTTRILPSNIEFYLYEMGNLSQKDTLMVNGNDLMDLWSKRLPHPDELKHIKTLTELLPTEKTVHYILKLGEESISNICMAQYEDAVVNSDRFAELVLRDVLRKELNLTQEELSKYRELYSRRNPDRAVVQVLVDRLGLKGNAIVSKWYKNSRIVRNRVIHALELESIDVNIALKAVEHNMRLIDLVINKSDEDFHWYQIAPDNYSTLFINGKGFSAS